jgi:cytochrome c-type biogenesis protein CcmE
MVPALKCAFRVTDGQKPPCRPISMASLPALFREGQGVVATGAMNASGTFIASEVLAKHDENTCRRKWWMP